MSLQAYTCQAAVFQRLSRYAAVSEARADVEDIAGRARCRVLEQQDRLTWCREGGLVWGELRTKAEEEQTDGRIKGLCCL